MPGSVAFAEPAVETGIWARQAKLDEPDFPTDDYYVCNAQPFVGKRGIDMAGQQMELD